MFLYFRIYLIWIPVINVSLSDGKQNYSDRTECVDYVAAKKTQEEMSIEQHMPCC